MCGRWKHRCPCVPEEEPLKDGTVMEDLTNSPLTEDDLAALTYVEPEPTVEEVARWQY